MDLLSTYGRLFAHDDWANREALSSLRRVGDVPRARRLLAHITAAEWQWLTRLRQDGKKVTVWPDLKLEECEAQIAQLRLEWRDYLSALSPAGLVVAVCYTNSKGERWENSVADILLHVPMHSSYHRGQIALLIREAGVDPAYTDYIQAVRSGMIR